MFAHALCALCFVGLLVFSVMAIFVISLLRTTNRDAASVCKIQDSNWRGLAEVIRAFRKKR